VVRYPRGGELYRPKDYKVENLAYDIYGDRNSPNLLITYGRLFSYACKAKEKLEEQGIKICILKLCKIKPIDRGAVQIAAGFKNIWFFEEGIKNGGIARNFSDLLFMTKFSGRYHIKAINDKFVKQMTVNEALKMLKLDSEGMVNVISAELGND
jgi:1-deoxy-D-xylulose-5-phosphate synthase